MTDLAVIKTKLETALREVATENKKLKESLQVKEEEKVQMTKHVETLTQVNQRLIRQEQEERELLGEKETLLQQLQQHIEERELQPINSMVSLAQELANSSPSYSKPKSKSEIENQKQDTSAEDEEWRARLGDLQRKHEVMKQKEEILLKENYVEKMDKEALMEDLKQFKTKKAQLHEFLSSVYELRERLFDCEIKNLTRAMRYVQSFEDLLYISGNVIDSVSNDAQKKVGDRHETEVGLIVELIVENCKLRKATNDFMMAIHRATVEKLKKFNEQWPHVVPPPPPQTQPQPKRKSVIWGFPLFDFFSSRK